nr:hypothetical protein [Candidatus Coxiella mudrowiae]
MRDNPALRHKPIAVGRPLHSRRVVCTENYIARQLRYSISNAFLLNQRNFATVNFFACEHRTKAEWFKNNFPSRS